MLKFGIIGTNQISEQFARACKKADNACVVAIYSRREETGNMFAHKCGIMKVYTDLSKMLLDSEIDAVYIASPNMLHVNHSKKALLHGKHVLCEKPVATSLSSFEEVYETAQETRHVYLEAMRPLYDPALIYIKKAMRKIGKIHQARLDFSQYSSRYDAYKNGKILNAFTTDLENASLLDLGIYGIEWSVALFGSPEDIFSTSSFLENGFEGHGSAILKYHEGLEVQLSYSKITESIVPSFITGEEGTILIEGKLNSPSGAKIIYRDGTVEEEVFEHSPENMVFEIEFFRDLCLNDQWNHGIFAYTRESIRILDKIRENNKIQFKLDEL